MAKKKSNRRTKQAVGKKREPGQYKGKIWAAPNAFKPLTKAELKDWGIE
jgi:hypothetical protein